MERALSEFLLKNKRSIQNVTLQFCAINDGALRKAKITYYGIEGK
jgi:hypothetical protein